MGIDQFIVLVVAFSACLLGPICGIGGGVLIKPTIDSLHMMDIAATSFLSSLTVLVMSAATLIQNHRSQTSKIRISSVMPIALGSALGGLVGKKIFAFLLSNVSAPAAVGLMQSCVLVILTCCALIYTVAVKNKISFAVSGNVALASVGLVAGMLWAFLGIGGGPFNFLLLSIVCGYSPKQAAQSSLVIIACSQICSLAFSVVTASVPQVSIVLAFAMAACAIGGSVLGRKIVRRMDNAAVQRLYAAALVLIIAICSHNVYSFWAAL